MCVVWDGLKVTADPDGAQPRILVSDIKSCNLVTHLQLVTTLLFGILSGTNLFLSREALPGVFRLVGTPSIQVQPESV